MVKNLSGEKASKDFASKQVNNNTVSRHLRISECPEEMYAVVTKMLGGNRCYVKTVVHPQIIGYIANKFSGRNKRSNMIALGTVLLVGLREWESVAKTVDVLLVYDPMEVIMLKKIPSFPGHLLMEQRDVSEEDEFIFSNEERAASADTTATAGATTLATVAEDETTSKPLLNIDFNFDDI